MKYEAFALNELCQFSGAFCNSLHFLGKMILLISICSNNPAIALLISPTSPLNEIRQPIFC